VTVPRGAVRDLGGLRRRDPVGGCANGIPLKDSTEDPVDPMMVASGEAMVTVRAPLRLTGEANATGRINGRCTRSFMIKIDQTLRSR
jgi:hypothetical protein